MGGSRVGQGEVPEGERPTLLFDVERLDSLSQLLLSLFVTNGLRKQLFHLVGPLTPQDYPWPDQCFMTRFACVV